MALQCFEDLEASKVENKRMEQQTVIIING